MASTQRERLTTYTTARSLLPATLRTGLLFVSWFAAVGMLLLLVTGVPGLGVSLATQREICFVGLLVVELAAGYQIHAYRQHRRSAQHSLH